MIGIRGLCVIQICENLLQNANKNLFDNIFYIFINFHQLFSGFDEVFKK